MPARVRADPFVIAHKPAEGGQFEGLAPTVAGSR
jgi:hypothetical protein